MPIFEYITKSPNGKVEEGEVSAGSSHEAVQVLRKEDVMILRLRERPPQMARIPWGFQGWGFNRVKKRTIILFTQQLSVLIRAGVPLLECLDILAEEMEHPGFQRMVRDIQEKVERGSLFAQALENFPDTFNEFYRRMVEVGETTGRLDESLSQLALYLDKQARLKSKLLSALAYPFLLVMVALTVLWFLLIWVVPLFANLFHDMGEALPWLTQVVILVANEARAHWWVLGGVLAASTVGIKWMLNQRSGRQAVDRLLLAFPAIGPLLQKAAIVRFSRTLGYLVHRGVSLLPALAVAGAVTGNKAMERQVEVSARGVESGTPLSEAMRVGGMFPPVVTQMIKVGEATGSLDTMLDKVADLFEQEVDRGISRVTAIVEPGVIVIVGGGIALIVVAMYLPIFSMGSVIQ